MVKYSDANRFTNRFRVNKFLLFCIALVFSSPAYSLQEDDRAEPVKHPVSTDLPLDAIPDLREDITLLKGKDKDQDQDQDKKSRDWVAVPIPMSSPTFGTGLILGGAYFYPQSEQQKESQPASFTGAAVGYTHNESFFAGVMQQNYWAEDKWRFNGVAGYADFKFELIPPEDDSEEEVPAWLVKGGIFQAGFSRRLRGDWYAGLSARYLDIQQKLEFTSEFPDFNLQSEISSPGIGLNLEYDTRDTPSNAYSGRRFEVKAIFAGQSQKEAGNYQGYYARFRSYHQLMKNFVFALDLNGCAKSGQIPLWDTCRLNLRGFPLTDYLSLQSFSAQAEARWQVYKRWGLVAFAGAGRVKDSFASHGEGETIPSYGVGLRFMVLESQRINVRVDYARSDNGSEAWYLGVTEAF